VMLVESSSNWLGSAQRRERGPGWTLAGGGGRIRNSPNCATAGTDNSQGVPAATSAAAIPKTRRLLMALQPSILHRRWKPGGCPIARAARPAVEWMIPQRVGAVVEGGLAYVCETTVYL